MGTVKKFTVKSRLSLSGENFSNVKVPISGFTYTLALNELGQATVYIPMGRNVNRVARMLGIDDYNKGAVVLTQLAAEALPRAQILTTIQGKDWLGSDQETVVYSGYVLGIGMRKARSQTQLVVTLIHDLYGLVRGSCASPNIHPGDSDLSLAPAIYPLAVGVQAGAGAIPGPGADNRVFDALASPSSAGVLSADKVKKDLWGALVGFFEALNTQASNLSALQAFAGANFLSSNDEAMSALAKLMIAPGVPLSMSGLNQEVASTISSSIKAQHYQTFFRQTIWDKIVGDYGPQYQFAVAPRWEGGYAIPHHPVLGGESNYWRDFDENKDVEVIETSCRLRRPLQAVGVYVVDSLPPANQVGQGQGGAGVGVQGGIATDLSSGAYYVSPLPGSSKGAIRYLQAPFWMTAAAEQAGHVASKTTGFAGRVPPGGAMHPLFPSRQPIPAVIFDQDFVVTYAQYLWLLDQYQDSSAVVNSALRFDVCPGSTVRILRSQDQRAPANRRKDLTDLTLYGYVQRVTVSISNTGGGSGQAQGAAGSSFQIGFVRSEQQQKEQGVALPRHPLYDQIWTGGPIVDDYSAGYR